MAVDLGLINKSGSFFNYNGKVIAQGREGTKMALKSNKKFSSDIEKKIRQKMADGKDLPKEVGEAKKPN